MACLEGALAPASSASALRFAQALLHLVVSLRSTRAVERGACGLSDLSALHPLAAWWGGRSPRTRVRVRVRARARARGRVRP